MKTLVRVIISTMIVLLLGSMPEAGAHARRSGHGPRVGVGLWLGPGWWGPYYYPSYYYPYYPYYRTEPPMIIQRQPEEYVQPAPEADEQEIFWYYCKNPQGYYPYVKECPSGWMKVVPSPPPPSSTPPE